MRLAIMQGRLTEPETGTIQAFPRRGWADEFPRAAAAGLAAIEWIYDRYGVGANPIETDAGVAHVRDLVRATGVGVHSVCADWCMEHPLLRAPRDARAPWFERVRWILDRCAALGAGRVVLPFVDQAAPINAADEDLLADAIERLLPDAERAGVELHLETALGPSAFAALLARLPHPLVCVNYDTGNSAACGFDVREEFAAYGARVGSVHVKDRVRGGGTVPLGSGSADLVAAFDGLRTLGYGGDVVLQVARGPRGDEVAWASDNRGRVERLMGVAAVPNGFDYPASGDPRAAVRVVA